MHQKGKNDICLIENCSTDDEKVLRSICRITTFNLTFYPGNVQLPYLKVILQM